MAARSRRRSWQFLLILAVLTVLASSRAVNQRRRQSDESSDRFGYKERVSNGQDDVGNADFLPSDSKNSQSGLNPLLDLSGLGDTSAFDVEDGELGGPFPKSLNDFYKGSWVAENKSDSLPNFKRRSGHIVFQIITRAHGHEIKHLPIQIGSGTNGVVIPSEVSQVQVAEIDMLQVDMVLRDGQYSSGRDIHAFLQGIFHRGTGEVKLWSVCSPDSPDCIKLMIEERAGQADAGNGSVGFGSGFLGTDMDQVLDGATAGKGGYGDESGPGGRMRERERCLFRARFQVQMQEDPPDADADPDGGAGAGAAGGAATVQLVGNISSVNCGLQLAFNASSMNFESYYSKAMRYTLMVTASAFVQVLLLVKQIEYSTTRNGAARVSLLTIGQQAVMDSYLCLAHLTMGIVVEALFNAFATAAFFKFMIFSIFEMRYLLIIWKARRPHAFQEGWERMRRELSLLYSRFYGCLLAGILIMFQLQKQLPVLVLLFYAFWIPQIVHSAQHDHRRPLLVAYIVGISLTRLLIPLYALACPHNFLHSEPNYPLAAGLVLFVAAQVCVLLVQHFRGPRFFVPRRFRPDKYDYYRRVPMHPTDAPDCAICMMPVAGPDATGPAAARVMTPCDHVFHRECLRQWMDIKMECPVCRRPIPDLDDDP